MKILIKEAVFVGILTVIVGTVLSKIFESNRSVPSSCKNWNKNYVMEKCLFLTGFIIHIFCEYAGLNKWYCKHGRACLK